jgi:hypothetical protein
VFNCFLIVELIEAAIPYVHPSELAAYLEHDRKNLQGHLLLMEQDYRRCLLTIERSEACMFDMQAALADLQLITASMEAHVSRNRSKLGKAAALPGHGG